MVERGRKYDRGVALLATLVTVALMTLLVVDFTTSAAFDYRSAANQANQMRASYLARSGIQVGLAVLGNSAIEETLARSQHVSLDQAWAQPIPPLMVDGGMVQISIVDEGRKFNLNTVYDVRGLQPNLVGEPIAERLFANLGISPELIPILIDWIDPDSIESDGGAEAEYYLSLTPPYEPRNNQIPTIGDLRMLKGMDDATFLRLSQFVTTVPELRVNLNTAPPELLAALAPQLENDPDTVRQIVEARQLRPFAQITDVSNEIPAVGQLDTTFQHSVGLTSQYFLITAQGDIAGARQRIYATFHRNMNGTAMLMNWHED